MRFIVDGRTVSLSFSYEMKKSNILDPSRSWMRMSKAENPYLKIRETTCIIREHSNPDQKTEDGIVVGIGHSVPCFIKQTKRFEQDNKFRARKYALKDAFLNNKKTCSLTAFTKRQRELLWEDYLFAVRLPKK